VAAVPKVSSQKVKKNNFLGGNIKSAGILVLLEMAHKKMQLLHLPKRPSKLIAWL
jgi:hypothetical protein